MERLLAAVLILFCLAGAMPVAAAPPAPPPNPCAPASPTPGGCLPWWQKQRPIIPSWYHQKRCYIAYWYLTQRTGVDAIGSPVTWQSYEPQWVCN